MRQHHLLWHVGALRAHPEVMLEGLRPPSHLSATGRQPVVEVRPLLVQEVCIVVLWQLYRQAAYIMHRLHSQVVLVLGGDELDGAVEAGVAGALAALGVADGVEVADAEAVL
jgi:phage gp36-like protein